VTSQARIPAPGAPGPRLEPGLALPRYRYVPGVLPHPFRDPYGHDHLATLDLPDPAWTPTRAWSANVHHRYALDLFENRFYWESHEVWEDVWLLLPRPSVERALLQALIQVAAATLKRHMGSVRAPVTLTRRARARLEQAQAAGDVVCGVDIVALVAALEAHDPWPRLTVDEDWFRRPVG
jgi:hypothetical protein